MSRADFKMLVVFFIQTQSQYAVLGVHFLHWSFFQMQFSQFLHWRNFPVTLTIVFGARYIYLVF